MKIKEGVEKEKLEYTIFSRREDTIYFWSKGEKIQVVKPTIRMHSARI